MVSNMLGVLKRQQTAYLVDMEQKKGIVEGNYVSGQGLGPVECHNTASSC